ncbi:MAG: DUF998 domain-containing protein [Halobacteriota archaeon]
MTSTDTELYSSRKRLLTLAGVCGIASIVIAVIAIMLAVSYSPSFDLTQNWISDLTGISHEGFLNVSRPVVNTATTEIIVRTGWIIAGVLGIVCATGLYRDNSTPSYRLGAIFAGLGAAAFVGVGLFPEPTYVPHVVASYAVFLLLPIGILLVAGVLINAPDKRLGAVILALAVIALIGAALLTYMRGVAEGIATLGIGLGIILLSTKMLRHASKIKQAQAPVPPVVQQTLQPQTATIDITEQIKKLGELRYQGLLTEQEFDSKKQELLARM